MIHNILILVNSYTSQLHIINKQFLDKYVYHNNLYLERNGIPAYNWRDIRYDPDIYNTIYTLNDHIMDKTFALLPLCMKYPST